MNMDIPPPTKDIGDYRGALESEAVFNTLLKDDFSKLKEDFSNFASSSIDGSSNGTSWRWRWWW